MQVLLIQLADEYAEDIEMGDADVPPEASTNYEDLPTVHVRPCLQWIPHASVHCFAPGTTDIEE